MDKREFDNQLRRQCFDIPVMCREQLAGIRKGVKASVPAEVLKTVRKVVITGCGDSYLAGIAGIPAFKKYSGAFASSFTAVRCIDAARFMEYEAGQEEAELVIGISASGGPARVVEALRRARAKGCRTLIITNNPESPAAKEAEFALIVHTPPFAEPGPGLRNYYASLLGLFALAAAMGEAKGICPEGQVEALCENVEAFTMEYGRCMERMDDEMFQLAGLWKTHESVETIGDYTDYATAYFIGAKYVEAAGMMAAAIDSENWCHVNYFKHGPEKISTIFLAGKDENNHSRVLESMDQALGIGRPVLLITDTDREGYGARPEAHVCQVPAAPEGCQFLAPLLQYIPGTLLAAYTAAFHEEPYFRGPESLQRRSAAGCTISDSKITVV